VFAVAEYTV